MGQDPRGDRYPKVDCVCWSDPLIFPQCPILPLVGVQTSTSLSDVAAYLDDKLTIGESGNGE